MVFGAILLINFGAYAFPIVEGYPHLWRFGAPAWATNVLFQASWPQSEGPVAASQAQVASAGIILAG